MSQPARLPYYPSAVCLLLPFFLCCLFPPHITVKMASGIAVEDECKCLFEDMKLHKCNEKGPIRLLTFTIQDDAIKVCKRYHQDDLGKDGLPEDAFMAFVSLLKEEESCYILYDCHYTTAEGHYKEDIVLGTWVPDSCSIKAKMIYASSKKCVKAICRGLKHDFQMNDRGDYCDRKAFAEQLKKNATTVSEIEGKKVN